MSSSAPMIDNSVYVDLNLLAAPQELPTPVPKRHPTLKMDSSYDCYRFDPDPDDVFDEIVAFSKKIRGLIRNPEHETSSSYKKYLVETISMTIYASNCLEKAGSSHAVTLDICQKILMGQEASENEAESEQIRTYLKTKSAKHGPEAVMRSRRQIVQHLQAFKYIVHRMVIRDESLSENIIKKTHAILTEGIYAENEDRDNSASYSGKYRPERASWIFVNFADPESIPSKMAAAVSDFNRGLHDAEREGKFDPFAFASKWHFKFINIHPFLNGNSRLSRLITNTILLKYTGIVIMIGRNSMELEKWEETTSRAFEAASLEGEYDGGKHPWAEMNTLIAMQGRFSLETLKGALATGDMGPISIEDNAKSLWGFPIRDGEDEEEEEEYQID